MSGGRGARYLATILIAVVLAIAGSLAGGATPALAKVKPRIYTFYVDSRGGVLYYHRSKACSDELDGVHVKVVRATVAAMKKAGYRPCPKCRPAGWTKAPKRFYASRWSRYYSQNRRARFITTHRGGRLTLTWRQVVRRRLIPDPKTKPYGWVGFRSYYQAEPSTFLTDLVAEINRRRAEIGNPPVSISTTRCVASESWADYLCRVHGVTGHATPHTSGMDWDTWQSVGVGDEGVGYTHEPCINLLSGSMVGAQEAVHVAPFVDDPTIAYIGAGVCYQRTSIGWDGYSANCVQADGDDLRGGSIEVTSAPLSISAATTTTATALITPDTPGDTFDWSIADSSVATVTGVGGVATITPLSPGTTTIHVRTGVSQVDATATISVTD